MEFGTFSSPESSSSSSSPEHTKDSDDDTKKSKKKSSGASAAAGIATGQAVKRDQPERPTGEKEREEREVAREAFWEKIKGKVTEPDKPDKPAKPEHGAKAASPALKIGETIIERPDTATEPGQPAAEASATAEAVETKLAAEQPELKAAAQEIIDKRLRAASDELETQPDDTLEAAEAAASVALLRAARDKMAEDAGTPVHEHLDAAEHDVIDSIQSQPDGPVSTEIAAAETADAVLAETALELPAVAEAAEKPATTEAGPARAESMAAGGEVPPDRGTPESPPSFEASDGAPPLPPVPPFEPPFGGVGGFGGSPHPEFSEGPGRVGYAAAEAIPLVAAHVVPVVDALHNERAAQNRGLLVGGIAGYFVGRRRGRRQGQAKAEKQAQPARRKLEQNIKDLEQTVASKQRHIESVVHDKVAALSESQGRKRLINQLLHPAGRAAAKAEAAKPAARRPEPTGSVQAHNAETQTAPVLAAAETVAGGAAITAARPIGELYSRSPRAETTSRLTTSELLINDRYQQEFGPANDVGRLLVEAPLAAVAVPLAAVEALRHAPSLRGSEQAPASPANVVPFNKKAEAFSRSELLETAAKIKVEGTSLKEMVDLGRLDEPALRRVVGEFLEGGDVSAAVSREVKQKEMKFERDPRMRQAAGKLAAGGSGSVSADSGQSDSSDASSGGPMSDPSSEGSKPASSRPGPTPDAATLKTLRNKQVATVGATVLLLTCAVLAALFLTR